MNKLQEAMQQTEEALDNLDRDIADAVSLGDGEGTEYSGDRKKIPTDSTAEMLHKARAIHVNSIKELELKIKGLEWLRNNTQTAIDSIDAATVFIADHASDQ